MVAIHVNSAGGASSLLDGLAKIVRALRPLQKAYKTARSVRALSPELQALSLECQALVDEDATGATLTLRYLLEDDGPSLQRHLNLEQCLSVMDEGQKFGSLEEYIVAQRQLLDGMSESDLHVQGGCASRTGSGPC